ncbi:hypothetical protein P6144_14085 [Sphingomonas sp. HITSZ_GF]|uniref:hypothetical protein n=1 Tax=Sphingomonas sp. HITSZ_GF TaxID=3037247 RepID=UPI00240D6A75|nr:hypothetical protein [Sphingomonas sp. HITSZ_GF]MDG2534788.1 hypothetical protein [Sphingomonas sp. HITSZ_GF]
MPARRFRFAAFLTVFLAAWTWHEIMLIGHASISKSLARACKHWISKDMRNEFLWDGDWESVTPNDAAWAEVELRRELAPGHILFGAQWTAVGRRWRRDDFLFMLADGRFAQVHLTRHAEIDPRWPTAEIFETFEDWKSIPPADR